MKKLLCLFAAVCFLFCTACTKNTEVEPSDDVAGITEENVKKETVEITLYFPDRQGLYLVAENREVEKDGDDLAQTVVTELMEGPESDELLSLIPEGTRLNSVTVKDGLCTVDLSAEFTDKASGGSASDTLCVYSIVNSLTELEGIDEVMFLIDGKTVEIYGNFIFDEPFAADDSINKK